jgi:hypothetical protein
VASFVAALLTVAVFQAAVAASKVDPLYAPPAGLVPTSAKLDEVLAQNRSAAGSSKDATSIEDWKVVEYGLSGTEHDVESGSDYREDVTLGPFTTVHGKRNGQLWRQNANGQTLLMAGVHQGEEVSGSVLRGAETGPSRYVTLIGQTAAAPPAYVVEVAPPDGTHEWIFYDAQSGQITRVESIEDARRVIYTYDDFRSTHGATRPWHIHASDGQAANDSDYTLTALQSGVPIPPGALDISPDRRKLVEFPPGISRVRLPAKIVNGDIAVRVSIAGRGFDVTLDSGSSEIVLDRGLVQRIGLQTLGRATQTIAGRFDRSRAIVPEMKIGDLTMHDVTVSSLPLAFDTSNDITDVGLLGFDFIHDVVLHIDYDRGTVDAIDPSHFEPETLKEAVVIPIALDDGVPLVQAQVGKTLARHFILDTGFDSAVLLFSLFVHDHPEDVKDKSGGRLNNFNPYGQAQGVGGKLNLVETQLDSFYFGLVSFKDFEVERLDGSPEFQGDDEDGLIGYEILKYYDVYLDYANQRVVLAPNALFHRSVEYTKGSGR